MTTDLYAEDVAWNLDELLSEGSVDELIDRANEITDTVETFRGKISGVSLSEFVELMNHLAQINELIGRAGNYVSLAFSVNTSDEAIGAQMQSVEERATQLQNRLLFVELEWTALSDEAADRFLNASELVFCKHWLEQLRKRKPHLLTEPEELVMNEKSVTGSNSWSRLFSELTSDIGVDDGGERISLEIALAKLADPDRDTRKLAAEGITSALNEGIRTRAFIFNTLVADKASDDRLRSFNDWLTSRNLDNEASDESVAALVSAVESRYDIPQRWYALKAQILGLDHLADYDRMAPLGGVEGEFSWSEGKEVVLDSYGSFSSEAADVVGLFFENPWIDAPVRPAKRGGAFCAYTVPSLHPYVLLNWTAKRRDVLTLAHELGHGLHAYLARPQGVFHQTTPLTLAETASVFGETVTFGRILGQVTDSKERFGLLAEQLENSIATVFRQIAMHNFETAVHKERREVGELSVQRFGDLWVETQSAMLGPAVELSEGYRSWWSYIPHFIHTPGYVYAYAYGQLLSLAVYHQYEERGPEFVGQYLDMLRSGGSKSPEELGRMVDCDLLDPDFWSGGLLIMERMLESAEKAASDLED